MTSFNPLPFQLSSTELARAADHWEELARAKLEDVSALSDRMASGGVSENLRLWREALQSAAERDDAPACRRLIALADPEGPNRPVLIIDDEPVNLRMLTVWLLGAGIKAQAAANGKQALDRIKKTRPRLALLDLDMPVMSGQEMLARLRANEVFRNLPVFILSGYDEAAIKIDRQDYELLVGKPLEQSTLFSALSGYFSAAE